MSDILERERDLAPGIDRAHVEARVRDWVARIGTLYDWIEEVLPPGWRARRTPAPRAMHEALMREFGVDAVNLNWLKLHGPDGAYWVVVPLGLWVIGANGGLSLDSKDGSYLIVDRAEPFEAPQWRIAKRDMRSASEPLTAGLLARALTK